MSDLLLKISELLNLQSCHAQWHSQEQPPVTAIAGISTDSRTTKPGELFFAIKGDKYDGHDFILQAVSGGAAACVVNTVWFNTHGSQYPQAAFITVPDSLIAYQEFARYYRKKFSIPVIAITGSSGKTTTKELVASVLAQKYCVLKNIKSFNNHIGVPATLYELRAEHEILVIELGTNHFGELRRLSYLVEPTACLLTNIGHAHLEHFDSVEGVLKAKMEIFTNMRQDGSVFFNADDKNLAGVQFPAAKSISYAIENNADVQGNIEYCDDYARYTFKVMGVTVPLQLTGRHNVSNALAAAAVGSFYSLTPEQIKAGLEKVEPADKRAQVIELKGIRLVNDSYNSNPGSCYAALATLGEMSVKNGGRRIAVLGDMKELGKYSLSEHEKLAAVASWFKIDVIYLYGNETRYTFQALSGYPDLLAKHFDNKNDLQTKLLKIIKENDIILIKGSRSMQMETIVEYVTTQLKGR